MQLEDAHIIVRGSCLDKVMRVRKLVSAHTHTHTHMCNNVVCCLKDATLGSYIQLVNSRVVAL